MISEVNNGYFENLPEEVVLNEVKLEDIEVAPVKAKNGKKAKLTSQLKTTKEVKALSTSLEDYLEKVFLLAKKYEEEKGVKVEVTSVGGGADYGASLKAERTCRLSSS